MAKKTSVKKLFKLSFGVTISLLVIAALFNCGYSVRSFAAQSLEYAASSLKKYTASFTEDLEDLQEFNNRLAYSNPSFQLLSLEGYSDSKRLVELYNLRQLMASHTASYGVTMMYDSEEDVAYFSVGDRIPQGTGEAHNLYNFLHQLGKEPERFGMEKYGQWFVAENQGDPYFILATDNRRSTLFSCINLRAYVEKTPVPLFSPEDSALVFTSQRELLGEGKMGALGLSPGSLADVPQTIQGSLLEGYFCCTVFLEDYVLGFAAVTPVSALVERVLPQILFAGLAIVVVLIILFAVYKLLGHILVLPLQEIAAMSQQLKQAQEPESVPLPSDRYQEFSEIKAALRNMRDDIVALEMEKQRKESEKEHAMLQYFQLQTRSHFFLNCLKSLYSMLENGELGRMKNMILGFSNHLRYIFHDTMSLVPLSEELKEVNDYQRILLLDSSRIFFIQQEVPAQFLSCKVPPLVIQTFLENTFKYNSNRSGVPLSFHIQVGKIEDEKGTYLQIRCYDNGQGYSPNVLEKINGELDSAFDQTNVGINNLRRRLSILFHSDFQTAFYNLPQGGACSVIFIPIIQ